MSNDANTLLDACKYHFKCESDAALARALYMSGPEICRLRRGKVPVGPMLIIGVHEETGFSIAKIKELAGLPPAKPMAV